MPQLKKNNDFNWWWHSNSMTTLDSGFGFSDSPHNVISWNLHTPTSSIPSPFDVITLFLKVLLPFFLIKPALLWGQWMALSAQRHHKMVNEHLPEMAIEQRCDCADTHGPARCRLLSWAGNVFFFTSESPSVKGSSKKGAHSEHWSHISSSSFRLLSWLSNL